MVQDGTVPSSHRLFSPELLDQLEGLNERYALLGRRIEELQDNAAVYDQPLDREQLARLQSLRAK